MNSTDKIVTLFTPEQVERRQSAASVNVANEIKCRMGVAFLSRLLDQGLLSAEEHKTACGMIAQKYSSDAVAF